MDDSAEDKFGFWFATPAGGKKRNADTEAKYLDGYYNDSRNIPKHYVRVADAYRMGLKEREQFVKRLGGTICLQDEDKSRAANNLGTMVEVLSHREGILQEAVIDENLPLDSPERHRDTDVLEIFVRVNTQGTRLNRSDLIFSWLKLSWKEAAQTFPEFIARVNKGNSLGLDADFVVQCLLAVSDLGTRRDLEVLRKRENVTLLRENFTKCCEAIRATVDFVIRDCSCQDAELLGGSTNLVPFVYYLFHMRKHELPNDQLERVRKSFYLLALARPFSRYGESRVGAFIREKMSPRIKKGDMSFPFDDLVVETKYWADIEALDERVLQHNVSLTLHLLQGLSGTKVQYADNSPEIDHIFPRSKLREQGYDEKLINNFANFWILAKGKNRNKSSQHPAEYFRDVSDRVLAQALIDRNMLDYRKFPTFVKQRSEAIVTRLKGQLGFKDEDFEGEEEHG